MPLVVDIAGEGWAGRAVACFRLFLTRGDSPDEAVRVEFDSDIEIWFVEDDANLHQYRAFLKRFEADEITVLGVFADDVFTPHGARASSRQHSTTMGH